MKFSSDRMAFSSLWPGADRYREFGRNVKVDGNNGFPQRKETERLAAKEGVRDEPEEDKPIHQNVHLSL